MCKYCCTYVEIPYFIIDFYKLNGNWVINQTNAFELLTYDRTLVNYLHNLSYNTPLDNSISEYSSEYYDIKKELYEKYFNKINSEMTNEFDIDKYNYSRLHNYFSIFSKK